MKKKAVEDTKQVFNLDNQMNYLIEKTFFNKLYLLPPLKAYKCKENNF
jgi:hypothetical protein